MRFLLILLVWIGIQQSIASESELSNFEKSELRLKEYCDKFRGYQPGSPDLLNALEILSIEAKISACTLHETMGLNENHNLYMSGFRKTATGNEFTYLLIDFSNRDKPHSLMCIATSTFEYGDNNRTRKEVFNISCKTVE